jgi:hypothetical protein
MAMRTELTEQERGAKTFEQKLARLRATPEERSRILMSAPLFDYESWVREAGPATPADLMEMENLLSEREEERLQSLADDERYASQAE